MLTASAKMLGFYFLSREIIMRKAICIVGLTLMALILPAQAGEAKRFPPYPDVWGLKVPSWNAKACDGFRISECNAIMRQPDGDFFIFERNEKADYSDHDAYSVYKFFAGGPPEKVNDAVFMALYYADEERNGGNPDNLDWKSYYNIKDVSVDLNYGIYNCHVSHETIYDGDMISSPIRGVEARNYNNRCENNVLKVFIIRRKSIKILQVTEYSKDPVNTNKLEYEAHVHFMRLSTHRDFGLDDGTFLAQLASKDGKEEGMNTVIRFKPDLTSPFLAEIPDLYVFDAEEITPILEEARRQKKADPDFNDMTFINRKVAALIDSLPKHKQ